MSQHATSTDSRELSNVDAVIEARLSRRAFCALAASGALCLAGGASWAWADGEPAGEKGEKAGSEPPQDGVAGSDRDGAAPATEPVKGSTFAYNTLVSITAYGVDESVVRECLKDCATYEGLFSARKEGTDVDRINRAGGEPVEVDERTAALISEALEFCADSDGEFDITIGSVTLLWDFMEAVKPDDDAIREALPHIDYRQVKVDGNTVTMGDPQAKIDLGGIAKGWICRELTSRLVGAGATAALVNLGTSSVYALGTKPDGSKWRIGLHDPLGQGDAILGVVELSDLSITSSGLYDQKFELDGEVYWHILDASTGYPAQTDMLGDTVLTDDPMIGDAMSTTMFVKGIDKAREWVLGDHPQMPAMFVDADGGQVFVNGFEDYVVA